MAVTRSIYSYSRLLRALPSRPLLSNYFSQSLHTATSNVKNLSSAAIFEFRYKRNVFPGLPLANRLYSSSSVPDRLWRLGRLNHIAIAVPDLEKATAFYRDALQASVSAPQALPEHGVTTVFVELDNTKLELLHPLGTKSPIEKFLQKNKSGGLHHICIEVNDIVSAMKDVSEAGIRCLSKEAKIGAHGKPVIFLHPADCNGVLLELEEA